jgi:plastocyanin
VKEETETVQPSEETAPTNEETAPATTPSAAESTTPSTVAEEEGVQSVGGLPNAGPDTGAIAGQVFYQGPPRRPRMVNMSADAQCLKMHGGQPVPSDEFVVGPNNELKWAFVYVEQVSGTYPAPSSPMVLDQEGCTYRPHVFGVMVGQPLEIRNSDPLLHNVHALPKRNKPFNFAQPVQGMTNTYQFDTPEYSPPITIKCDVHPWMRTYCAVMPHPFFAVTNSQGQYKIQGLPPGTYTVKVWHEKLGTQTQTVTVQAGQTATVNFTLQR